MTRFSPQEFPSSTHSNFDHLLDIQPLEVVGFRPSRRKAVKRKKEEEDAPKKFDESTEAAS